MRALQTRLCYTTQKSSLPFCDFFFSSSLLSISSENLRRLATLVPLFSVMNWFSYLSMWNGVFAWGICLCLLCSCSLTFLFNSVVTGLFLSNGLDSTAVIAFFSAAISCSNGQDRTAKIAMWRSSRFPYPPLCLSPSPPKITLAVFGPVWPFLLSLVS